MTNPTDTERLAPALVSVPENVLQGLHEMIDGRDAEIATLRAERDDILKAEHALSVAYLRLRSLISCAYNTPLAPSPEQVWETTETALRKLRQERDAARAEVERLRELFEATRVWGATPPTTDDMPTAITLGSLTDEQQEYLRDLTQRARDYDPETIIGDPEAERRRLADKTATDDVERTRETENLAQQLIDGAKRPGVDTYTKTLLWHASDLIDRLSAAREQSRAEGAREMRERVLKRIADFGSGHAVTIAAAIRSLPEDSQ